jgi:hypothetical protein
MYARTPGKSKSLQNNKNAVSSPGKGIKFKNPLVHISSKPYNRPTAHNGSRYERNQLKQCKAGSTSDYRVYTQYFKEDKRIVV